MHNIEKEVHRITGLELSRTQWAAFERYYELLVEWNQRFNLTALSSREEIYRKHFLDSLSCVQAFGGTYPDKLVDVGAGAGFPGIPLKILQPTMKLTLIESSRKKAGFLELVAAELQLKEVEVISLRAEEAGRDSKYREQFDWAVARAVAPLPVLAEYLLPLVQVGGFALAQKGAKAREEAMASEKAVALLGGKLIAINPVEIDGMEEERHLVLIEKTDPTPEKYPRKAGIPKKRPLA